MNYRMENKLGGIKYVNVGIKVVVFVGVFWLFDI